MIVLATFFAQYDDMQKQWRIMARHDDTGSVMNICSAISKGVAMETALLLNLYYRMVP